MTLFISFLLIYNFQMDWYWYGIAAAIWGAHFAYSRRKQLAGSIAEQLNMKPRDLPRVHDEPRDLPRVKDEPRELPRIHDEPRDLPRVKDEKE